MAPAFGPKDWLFLVALVVAVFAVYQPAWHGGLLWDDGADITRPELRSWHGLYRIWFNVGTTQQYYPLSESAFWLQYKLWGDAMPGYHLVNIAFHALTAVLAALVLRQLAIPGAYLAAAVFALHPIHAESVAWITEQKNTLSAVFYLGAALAYLRFDRNRSTAWYFAALGLFVLAMASKIVTVTLPAALLVIFWWQRGKLSWRRDVLPLAPLFAIGLVAGVFVAWVERKLVAPRAPTSHSPWPNAVCCRPERSGFIWPSSSGRPSCTSCIRVGKSIRRRGGNTCFPWRCCCCWPCCGASAGGGEGPWRGCCSLPARCFRCSVS